MIDTVDRVAPNFRASVLGRRALTPLDLEREFGLDRRRHLPRRAVARPAVLGAAGAGPRQLPAAGAGLYLCGAGAHPGGGVTGLPGHNAAREILKDVRAPAVLIGRPRMRRAGSDDGRRLHPPELLMYLTP